MAIVPFAAAAGGSAFMRLVGILLSRSHAVVASKNFLPAATGIGIATSVADVINLDFLNREALKAAGNSSPEGLRDAANFTARLLGLDGTQVLWPIRRGQPITPKYVMINIRTGLVWYSDRYYSASYVRKLKMGRFGGFRRFGSWRRGGAASPINVRNG